MPYKSEKIKIAGTKYDRRIKLTEDQKEYIRWLREEEKLSQMALAKMFGVSKRLIQFVIQPDKLEKNKQRLKEAKKKGLYKPSKEEWNEIQREHRRYKHKLRMDGKIT